MRIAIVGAGVAGLTAAHYLREAHEVWVFERNGYAGGHAHTQVVAAPEGDVALDTGFLVYNERTYPHFVRLLDELGVATQPSEMSFSVRCERCRLEYSGRSLAGLFAHPRQLLSPSFHRMLVDILRFNHWARRVEIGQLDGALTLGDALARGGFSGAVARHYLVPMTAAIWSGTADDAWSLPLGFFLTFFRNHGLLRLTGQPQWRTIVGGSHRYVEALIRPLGHRLRLGEPVRGVTRAADGVTLCLAGGETIRFDRVVMATHADRTLELLRDVTPEEAAALAAIPYRRNEGVLHTDATLLPRSRRAWASWNYRTRECREARSELRMTYLLNQLQRFESRERYCVTLNDAGDVRPDRVIARLAYSHPVYRVDGLRARRRLAELSGRRHTFFCGAYLGYGFHEDGVRSALDVVEACSRGREAA